MNPNPKDDFMANWMGVLRPHINATKLTSLSIPGSHDSNTVWLSKWSPLYRFAACQSLGIYEQLEQGVRMLDLRYGVGKTDFDVIDQHGPVKGGDLFRTFHDVKRFVEDHPNEFVIVNMQSEANLSPVTNSNLIERLFVLLGTLLINGDDMDKWFKFETVTMGEIMESPKRILLFAWENLWSNSKYDKAECRKFGIHLQEECIVSRWHNTDRVSVMFQNNINDLQEWNGRNLQSNKLFAIQNVLTIQGNIEDVMKYIYLFEVPTIKNMAKKVTQNNKLLNFLFQALSLGANLMIFDFIELEIVAMRLIILSNLKHDITVHGCFAGPKDCHEFAKPGLLRNRMVLITNIKKIFEMFKGQSKEILIVYSETNGPFKFQVISNHQRHMLIYSSNFEEKNFEPAESQTLILFEKEKYIVYPITQAIHIDQIDYIVQARFPAARPVFLLNRSELHILSRRENGATYSYAQRSVNTS
jgi:hypothetical protein